MLGFRGGKCVFLSDSGKELYKFTKKLLLFAALTINIISLCIAILGKQLPVLSFELRTLKMLFTGLANSAV